MVYVFKTSEIYKNEIHPEIPKLVGKMLENTSVMQYSIQKQSYAHSLYFIYRENRLYNTLLDACQIRLSNVESEFTEVQSKCTTLTANIEKLTSEIKFSKNILEYDMEQYLKQFSQNATHWQSSHQQINDEVERITEISIKLHKRISSVNKRMSIIKNESENKYSKFSKHNLNKL